jgi:hypothetical protein
MPFQHLRRSAAAIAIVAVSACSGGGNAPLPGLTAGAFHPPLSAQRARRHRGAARFVIRIPRRPHRRPAFISPSTASLRLTVAAALGGDPVIDRIVNLTPRSPGCSRVGGSAQCTLSVQLFDGRYVAGVTTFDGLNGGGNVLSTAQRVPFSVTAETSSVGLTLDGIPHGLQVASGSYAVLGSQTGGGFTVYGASAQPLIVTATDADGNAIVGPGSPSSFSAALVAGAGWAVAGSSAAAPNSVYVTPPSSNGPSASIRVEAHYADRTICVQTGASCSVTVTAGNREQRLFVANASGTVAQSGNVTAYDPPYTGAPALTITSGTSQPQSLMLDRLSNLFVNQCDASCGHAPPDRIEIYAPPYTSAPATTITNGVSLALGLSMDDSRNLFASYIDAGKVGVYAPPYTGVPTVISGLIHPWGMGFDPAGDLFVTSAYGGGTVTQFAPPFTGPPTAIGTAGSNPVSLLFDGAGNLYVAQALSAEVLVYAPPYTGLPVQTISLSVGPSAILMDASGNLFANGAFQNEVEVLSPPYTGAGTIVSAGLSFPLAMVLDAVGNLFVANGRSVTVYAPPYTGTPATISSGISEPSSLVLSP